ncbi:thiamine phosphate synthase [Bartonella henselae]|uniref:thiamine phosphate synthase n=1 Tax=Bartonella henselae TaxID=38323 RepID=UPI000964ACEB|nr:thiamine phosphate synthase [Bartonella henselae]OLL37707.1 thiamine-phosphate pyrophosphorylase [Bartonella henselae]OLL43646.1 thiamine-phosphate pyrophosphorylase [Bartonella henselae]
MTKQKSKPVEYHPFPQLVLTLDVRRSFTPTFLRQILQTRSFACVILYDSQGVQDDAFFLQKQAQIYAEDIQSNGAAFLISGERRVSERIKADGLHIEGDLKALEYCDYQKKEQKIIGFGNIRNRHCAMVAGEAGVDYLLFGKLGADKKPHAHPRNLQLARWWAEIMETPAIVQAGSDFATFDEVIKTACEFIAIEEVIFAHDNPLMLLKMMQEKCKNSPL